jgi:Tfp pilus assembly protein PilV
MKNTNTMEANSGQTIIEAVVALTAIVVAIAAISVVISLSVNNSTFSRDQNQASKYAQEGVEFLREANDSGSPIPFQGADPLTFNQLNGDYCLNADDTLSQDGIGADCRNVSTKGLKRSINIQPGTCAGTASNPGTSNTILTDVHVTVYWSGNSCSTTTPYCHNSSLETCIQTGTTSTSL